MKGISYKKSANRFFMMRGELVYLSEAYASGMHTVMDGAIRTRDRGSRRNVFQVEFRNFNCDKMRDFLFKKVVVDGNFIADDGDVRFVCGWIKEE